MNEMMFMPLPLWKLWAVRGRFTVRSRFVEPFSFKQINSSLNGAGFAGTDSVTFLFQRRADNGC